MISSYLPVGPIQQNMAQITKSLGAEGIECHQLVRGYDRICWPHAKRGFFPFKENIPKWLKTLP
jgi:deoxyribodipyrimidine photo-lyase